MESPTPEQTTSTCDFCYSTSPSQQRQAQSASVCSFHYYWQERHPPVEPPPSSLAQYDLVHPASLRQTVLWCTLRGACLFSEDHRSPQKMTQQSKFNQNKSPPSQPPHIILHTTRPLHNPPYPSFCAPCFPSHILFVPSAVPPSSTLPYPP